MDDHTQKALLLGLLRFPTEEQPFLDREGKQKPYLLDTRGAGANVELRKIIVGQISQQISSFPDVEVIGGISKSGTTWGAWLAWERKIPFANILLDGPRASGLQREVEGDIRKKRLILIDNWLRKGESARKAIEVCRRNGGEVVGVIAVAAIGELDIGVPLRVVWYLPELLKTAHALGLINNSIIE